MQIKRTPEDSCLLIVEIDDSVNDDVAEQFVETIEHELASGMRNVILDCRTLDFLSSFGLSMMLRMRTAAKLAGGELKVCDLSALTLQVMEKSRVAQLFDRRRDVNDALHAFAQQRRAS